MKVFAIEINNLTTGVMCGSSVQQGSMSFKVDRMPKDAVYERHGKFLISNTDGVWRHYTIGSQGGFAGRKITLRMKGGTVFKNKGHHLETFDGNLWDTADGHNKCQELAGGELISVSLKRSGDRGCYCGGFLFSRQDVERKVGHLIRLARPTMNSEIQF